MDGIAIHYESFKNGIRSFSIEAIQAAGEPPYKLNNKQACIEIMTGSMLPEGTDTVIRFEDLEVKNGIAKILIEEVEHKQNIHPKGQDAKEGELLLSAGIKISPAEIAVMASVGKSNIHVLSIPSIAIVSTGDELVEINQSPKPWQVRRSNAYALQAAFAEMNYKADQFHIPDSETELKSKLTSIFENYQLIILSGGISKGKFDFVPTVLEQLGVNKLFHQVTQRPGKPFWFGKSSKHIVFALPGNPVSTYLCFYRYIKPWLQKSCGLQESSSYAQLATDFTFKPSLTYFLQVKVKNESGKLIAYPDAGGGSGDFANLKHVDGFLELPANSTSFKAGEVFPYYSFR
jgi:molybdopterin molybdotransferase